MKTTQKKFQLPALAEFSDELSMSDLLPDLNAR